MELAIQIASYSAAVAALVLGIIAIVLSLYFYRRNRELYDSLNKAVSGIESSTKVTEVVSKDMIGSVVQVLRESVTSGARGHIESLRGTVMQRSAAGLEEALKGLPDAERSRAREAVFAEIDSFLGTLKDRVSSQFSPPRDSTTAGSTETIPTRSQPIPGSISYDWMPFVRRIRDLQAENRFLSVKMLREKVFQNEPELQEALQIAIDRKMLSTHYVDNPKNPQFPTLACQLSLEHPAVREIIRAIGEKPAGTRY